MKITEKFKNLDSLTAFLILECLAITGFSLGGENALFYTMGIILGVVSIFYCYKRFDKSEFKSLVLFVVPMFLLSIFVSFGKLFNGQGAINVLVLLSINCFFIMGICSNKLKNFNKETMLITLGASIALLTLISMIYSWINYGFFYSLIYKDTPNYFYDAIMYDVTKEGGWLIGFKVKEVSLLYSGAYGIFLCSYLCALIFINPKENLRKFLIFLSIGSVGLIYLLTIPNVRALLFLMPIALFALYYRFLKDNALGNKIISISLIVIYSLGIIGFILMIINKQNDAFASFLSSNAFLNRLFNANRVVDNANKILALCFKEYNLFGFTDSSLVYETQQAILINTKIFEIELIKESGIFSVIILLVIIPIMFVFASKYLKNSNDNNLIKIVVISLLLSYFIYSSFENDILPIIHESINYISFFRRPLTLIMLFLLGTIYTPILFKKEEIIDEK